MTDRKQDQQGDGYETGGDPGHDADTGSNDRDGDGDIERAGDRIRGIVDEEGRARTGRGGGHGSSGTNESGGTSNGGDALDTETGLAGETHDGTQADGGEPAID
jgi:hypothetical protein